jgi:hypothetical protein
MASARIKDLMCVRTPLYPHTWIPAFGDSCELCHQIPVPRWCWKVWWAPVFLIRLHALRHGMGTLGFAFQSSIEFRMCAYQWVVCMCGAARAPCSFRSCSENTSAFRGEKGVDEQVELGAFAQGRGLLDLVACVQCCAHTHEKT